MVISNASILNNGKISEVKEQIYQMVLKGINYRDISQKEFSFDGRKKKFSIAEISKIKKEFESQTSSQNKDLDKALAFKLFKKGKSSVEVVIETGFSYDFIKKSHAEFLDLEDKVTVPKWFKDYIYKLALNVKASNTLGDVYRSLKEAVDSHQELQKHVFTCIFCKKPIRIRGKALDYAVEYLSNELAHNKCS